MKPRLEWEFFHYDRAVCINRMLGAKTSMIRSYSQQNHHLEINVVHMTTNLQDSPSPVNRGTNEKDVCDIMVLLTD